MKIKVFSSGSSGNCTVVRSNGANILIDAGISKRLIENNLKDVGRTIILEFIKSIKYKEYLSLQEKENKIKNIAILTKTISLELEQDLLISKKELLLKELKEIILELESVLKEEQRERNRLWKK